MAQIGSITSTGKVIFIIRMIFELRIQADRLLSNQSLNHRKCARDLQDRHVVHPLAEKADAGKRTSYASARKLYVCDNGDVVHINSYIA